MPLGDQLSGRSREGYACNLRLVSTTDLGGRGGDTQMTWYRECVYRSVPALAGEDGDGIAVVDMRLPSGPRLVRVIQELSNLVTNPLKFSPPDSEVTVTARRDGASVRFTVEDRGRGIPPDRLPWIFEPFEQAHEDSARLGGVGLGLSISRRIVEGHGGRIIVESRPGEGTTFTFWLPAVARGDLLPDLDAAAPASSASLSRS